MTPSPKRPGVLFEAQRRRRQQTQQPTTGQQHRVSPKDEYLGTGPEMDTGAGVAQSPVQSPASPFAQSGSCSGATYAQAGFSQHALAMCFQAHQQQQQQLWQQQQQLWHLSVRLTEQFWAMWQQIQIQMQMQVCCSMNEGERFKPPVVVGGSRSRQ